MVISYLKQNPKKTIVMLLLGIAFGIQYGFQPEAELRETARYMKQDWYGYIVLMCVGIVFGLLFRIKKVRDHFSGKFNNFIFSLIPNLGLCSFAAGLTSFLITFFKYQNFEYSHFGIHGMCFGITALLGCIVANAKELG